MVILLRFVYVSGVAARGFLALFFFIPIRSEDDRRLFVRAILEANDGLERLCTYVDWRIPADSTLRWTILSGQLLCRSKWLVLP